MMTIMTFRGFGRDGRIQQCLVRSRYSICVRNSFHPSVGMIENASGLESQAFPQRLAAELEQVGLAGHTCSGSAFLGIGRWALPILVTRAQASG